MLHLLRQDVGTGTWNGADVGQMDRAALKAFRAKVQAVVQDPSGALNPRKRIRTILGEVTRFYGLASSAEAVDAHSLRMLQLVACGADSTRDLHEPPSARA